MLTISAAQFQALDDAIGAPQRRLRAQRALQSFPRWDGLLDAQRVEHLLRVTDLRAAEHGLGCERGAALFAHLALRFGIDWDRDPQLGWSTASSDGSAAPAPVAAIAVLGDAVAAYRMRVTGADDARWVSAAQRFVGRPAEQWLVAAARSQADLQAHLAWLHPEKRAGVPDATLAALVRLALDDCRAIGMAERSGIVLATVLAFLFGSGVLRDPVYIEIRTALADPARPAADRIRAAAQVAGDWVQRNLLDGARSALPLMLWPIPALDQLDVEPLETMIVRPRGGRV